jgi:hypothetical protein
MLALKSETTEPIKLSTKIKMTNMVLQENHQNFI